MLEHRGYTHTVLGCLVLTLLLYAGAEWWLRYRRLAVTHRDRFELLGMSMFGTFLHLAMDFLNSYGVHPFWPVQNAWFYGDSVFIVEPLYWAAAAPLAKVLAPDSAGMHWISQFEMSKTDLAQIVAGNPKGKD